MTKEVAVREPMSVVANSPDQLGALQAPLAGWAKIRLDEAKSEYEELTLAVAEAKKHKWKTSVLTKAASGALSRVTFYDKVTKALDAGYMLFPPVPNADVIAVRLSGNQPPNRFMEEAWGFPRQTATPKEPLPASKGNYKDPVVHWMLFHTRKDEKGNIITKEWKAHDLGDPVFPLAMAKPSIIAATNAAMEQKVFDEIRMFPFERRPKGDPCILGSIIQGKTDRRLYFLISWRIDARDI
jgi:hypothetical protein